MRTFRTVDYVSIGFILVWAIQVWSAMPTMLASAQGSTPEVTLSWSQIGRYIVTPILWLVVALVFVLERKQTARECGIELGREARIHYALLAVVFLILIMADGFNRANLQPGSGLVSMMLNITASEIMFRALTISLIIRHFGDSKLTTAVAVIISSLLFVAFQPQLHDRLELMAVSSLISSFLVMSGGSILIVIVMDTFTMLRGSSIQGQAAVPLVAMVIYIIMATPVWIVGRLRLSQRVAEK